MSKLRYLYDINKDCENPNFQPLNLSSLCHPHHRIALHFTCTLLPPLFLYLLSTKKNSESLSLYCRIQTWGQFRISPLSTIPPFPPCKLLPTFIFLFNSKFVEPHSCWVNLGTILILWTCISSSLGGTTEVLLGGRILAS